MDPPKEEAIHNYTYSFEPKADYSSVLASSSEIKEYFEGFAVKYDLLKDIRTQHQVVETSWDQEKGRWNLSVTDLKTQTRVDDWCHILIHATGYLNKPAWPSVPGIEKFRGPKLHSAKWDDSVTLQGKNILLVGSGASSVQILPAIQPIAKSVKVFVRTPRWTLPSVSSKKGTILPEEIERFIENPHLVTDIRLTNEQTLNSFFTMYMKGTILQQQARDHLESEMKKVVMDEEARKKLVPDFPVGSVYAGVTEFTETGCISEGGQSHEGDIVIAATGFDTSFIPRYPILFDGHNLQEDLSKSITGYLGVGISECPNSFTLAGPWTPISNACAEFKKYIAEVTNKMVWSDNCRHSHNIKPNWGQPSITWPGSTLHYLEAIREPRFEDYDFGYSGNKFSWLGNGLSQTEWDPTADLAYYIRTEDDGRHLSRGARTKVISKSGSQPIRQLHRQAKLATTRA
ncbi:hypothetical protein FGRMN_10175 [Fusarium graminum]|nr:hypothetical protein FGRMN_10175 [Fusarium graminum]